MLSLILLILAFVCFVLATLGITVHPRCNVTCLGLALWVLSIIIESGALS